MYGTTCERRERGCLWKFSSVVSGCQLSQQIASAIEKPEKKLLAVNDNTKKLKRSLELPLIVLNDEQRKELTWRAPNENEKNVEVEDFMYAEIEFVRKLQQNYFN